MLGILYCLEAFYAEGIIPLTWTTVSVINVMLPKDALADALHTEYIFN